MGQERMELDLPPTPWQLCICQGFYVGHGKVFANRLRIAHLANGIILLNAKENTTRGNFFHMHKKNGKM